MTRELPRDLWDTLLSVWRASAGRRAAAPSAGLSADELHSVSRQVRELSRGFTRERALAGERYLSDPGLLGAYLLHFWPVSYAQTLVCLEMLRRSRAMRSGPPFSPGSVLDVGAGPGPVAAALLEAGAARVTACDRSAAALALARRIAAARGRALTTHTWDCTRPTGMPKGPFDLIALGHTLNELWAGHPDRIALRTDLVTRLAGELAPEGRIFILEPALKSTAQEAIQVRDGLLRAGFRVELPCIWQNDCPALPEGTCHGEFEWKPPPAMVRLAHAARIGRETLKMAWFILGRRTADEPPAPVGATPDGGLYRVVSEPLLSKSGRVRYLVCGPGGRFALSARRDNRSAGLKPFFGLARGDGVRFSGAQARESGWGVDEGRVEIVERAPRLE